MRYHTFLRTLALLALIGAACSPAPAPLVAPSGGQVQPATTAAPQAFTLRVGTPNLAATLDAQAIIGLNPRRYGIWDALLNQDETGKLVPSLATEWKNVNPTTWQFKLAQGRKFSDGNVLTADDVVWSWTRAIDPANKLGITGRLGTLEKAEKVDAQTVNLITKVPDALLPKRAAVVIIMQKAIAEKARPEDLSVKAVGTGPYMVKEFVPSDHITLVPNPNSPVRANASELIVRNIPEASARNAGLRAGELDLIANVPLNQTDQIKSGGFQIINFNQGSTIGGIIFTLLQDQPTNNKLVRQAMNYAIDKDAIVKNIYLGYPQPTGQLVQKTTVGYDPNIKPYPYDPAKAKQLLAQAGYPNGIKIKMDVLLGLTEGQALYLFIQDQFKAVGIESEINASADPAFNTDRFYGRVARANILAQSLNNSPAMDADFAISWFSGKRPDSERWYNNPEFDAAYAASQSEFDEAKRTAVLQKALGILHDDAPFLYIIDGFTLWAAAPTLGNILVRGDGEPRFDLITKK